MGLKSGYGKVAGKVFTTNKLSGDLSDLRRLLDRQSEEIENLKMLEQELLESQRYLQRRIDEMFGRMEDLHYQARLERNYASSYRTEKSGLKVLVVGYYGACNTGDEIMLETILQNLPKNKKLNVTIMISNNDRFDMYKYGKCSFVHYPSKSIDIDNLAQDFDCLLVGGGALIDDAGRDYWWEPLRLGNSILKLVERFISHNKKTVLMGISTNKSFSDNDFIRELRYVVENADYFSVRDTNSLKTLEKFGIDITGVKLVDDIAIANPLLDSPVRQSSSSKTIVGLILMEPFEYENGTQKIKNYINNIMEYLDRQKQAYEIRFIPYLSFRHLEEKFYRNLINELNIESQYATISIMDTPANYQEAVNSIANCSAIVSMRYHGTLLGGFLNKNTLCLKYSAHKHYPNKIDYLCSHYNLSTVVKLDMDNDNIPEPILEKVLGGALPKTDYLLICKNAQKQLRQALGNIVR